MGVTTDRWFLLEALFHIVRRRYLSPHVVHMRPFLTWKRPNTESKHSPQGDNGSIQRAMSHCTKAYSCIYIMHSKIKNKNTSSGPTPSSNPLEVASRQWPVESSPTPYSARKNPVYQANAWRLHVQPIKKEKWGFV